MSSYRGYYDQFRSKDRAFEAQLSLGEWGGLEQETSLGNILYFEITQDCNIGGEYLRCFYVKKDDSNKIFEEVPLKSPKFRFIEGGEEVELPSNNASNTNMIGYMLDKFNCGKRRYCLYGECKTDSQIHQDVSTRDQNSSLSSSSVQE